MKDRYIYRWGFVRRADNREYKYVLKRGFVFREEIPRPHRFVTGKLAPLRVRPGQIIECNDIMDVVMLQTQDMFLRRIHL